MMLRMILGTIMIVPVMLVVVSVMVMRVMMTMEKVVILRVMFLMKWKLATIMIVIIMMLPLMTGDRMTSIVRSARVASSRDNEG